MTMETNTTPTGSELAAANCSLLPCPFCGADDPDYRGRHDCHYIQCEGCGASGPDCDNEEDAEREWNMRANTTPTDGGVPTEISLQDQQYSNAVRVDCLPLFSLVADLRQRGKEYRDRAVCFRASLTDYYNGKSWAYDDAADSLEALLKAHPLSQSSSQSPIG